MATTTRKRVSRVEEDTNGDGDNGEDKPYRLSISIDPSHRKKFRIAAAFNDLEVGQWAAKILQLAADKALKDKGVG